MYLVTNQYANTEELQPCYKDTMAGEEQRKVNLSDIYYVEGEKGTQYLNIAAFNMNKEEEVNIQSFLGMGQQIYANENNMYVTNTKYKMEETTNREISSVTISNPTTQIYKFKMSNTNVEFKEFAEVEGSIINQFSMDETGGYFRIATTTLLKNNTTSNNLYVLDARLNKVGEITGIAKGERIYAVRFIGDKAYMVTYEQTDPLFVIDLSKASEPKILGELKIPGFSNYLHPYDENHLIGIGQDTEVLTNGNTRTSGLKISLFDVSDTSSPKEVSNLVIKGNSVYTQALYNHKALLFIREKGLLIFPITISTGGKTAIYATEVVSVNLEDGVKENGRIVTDEKGRDWTKSVDRIIYIKDNIYNICRSGIIENNIETLQEINRVDF